MKSKDGMDIWTMHHECVFLLFTYNYNISGRLCVHLHAEPHRHRPGPAQADDAPDCQVAAVLLLEL